MEIKKNISLQAYNTFGLNVKAEQFAFVKNEKELKDFLIKSKKELFILGGGSNILLTKNVKGLVLKNEIKGIEVVRNYKHCVHVAIGSGENWHQFVLWAIENNYAGVENLSLIPGTVGAAPIQNIGAYGVELKDVFVRLEAIELKTGRKRKFTLKDCAFGYRDSVFKRKFKHKYFISKVILKLQKKGKLNISYGAIKTTLKAMGINNPGIKEVSDAVIKIRSSKLPDPKKLGNAGSFFKNPTISKTQFKKLQKAFPNIVFYELPNNRVKIPAGWLIEQCGWKGKRVGETGSHAKQSLVLVNYGNAKGKAIAVLAEKILASVEKIFGIQLQSEVNII